MLSFDDFTFIEKLWAYVLLQAVRDYFGSDKYWTPQARNWFHSSDYKLGSFIGICNIFGISPDYFLETLHWFENQDKEPAQVPHTTSGCRTGETHRYTTRRKRRHNDTKQN